MSTTARFPAITSECRGIVTGKREEEGLSLVDVDLQAQNQCKEITARGSATVALPRRKRF
jgi:hypothetical protein